MRYSDAWAKLARTNLTYKTVSIILGAVSIFLSMSVLKLALREPIVVERQWDSNHLIKVRPQPSEKEIKEFLYKSLPQRFNTETAIDEGYLSPEEIRIKRKEQKELASRSFSQSVVIQKIEISEKENKIKAWLIRLVFVKSIISPIPFEIEITLESKTRNILNPYGLILSKTSLIVNPKQGGQHDS